MTDTRDRLWRRLLAVPTAVVGLALAAALLENRLASGNLAATVADALPHSGVSNPVTAVLLNFRAFDTLLEIAVLLLALIGIRALRLPAAEREQLPHSSVFDHLLHFAAPILVVIAAYLLWVGATAPGGAFQAGAVLAGAGVLLHLGGLVRMPPTGMRLLATVGLLVFVGAGIASLLINGEMLQYPVAYAGAVILAIEVAATISIAAVLTAAFVGSERSEPGTAG